MKTAVRIQGGNENANQGYVHQLSCGPSILLLYGSHVLLALPSSALALAGVEVGV